MRKQSAPANAIVSHIFWHSSVDSAPAPAINIGQSRYFAKQFPIFFVTRKISEKNLKIFSTPCGKWLYHNWTEKRQTWIGTWVNIINDITWHFDQFDTLRRVQIWKWTRLTLKHKTRKTNWMKFFNIFAYCIIVDSGRYSTVFSNRKMFLFIT